MGIIFLARQARVLVPRKYYPALAQVFFRLLSMFYKGNWVTCPCCGGNFRRFLPLGKRSNVWCPRCGSMERHRLLWLYLKYKTNLFTDMLTLLHFAPEFIYQKVFKRLPNLAYISADLDSPLAMLKADITNISCQNNAFDVILYSHVLEHIVRPQT